MQTSADQTTAVHCRLQCLGTAQQEVIFFLSTFPGFFSAVAEMGWGLRWGTARILWRRFIEIK